jgi:hypothetical protein
MEHDPPDDIYLFIVHLALQRYSLEIDEFYKLTDWRQIFKHPNIVRSAYIALDLWKTENFVGLHYKTQNDARLIHLALLNA